MTGIEVAGFAAACLMLVLAHTIRAVRWALLYPANSVSRFNLLIGLTLGNVVNAILPFRIGELVRLIYVRRRETVSITYIGATILAERVSDLVVVGIGGLILAWATGLASTTTALVMLAAAALVIAVARVTLASRRMRKLAWKSTWIFNDHVRFRFCDLLWSLGEFLGPSGVLHPNYLLGTLSMWAAYVAAFWLFAVSIGAAALDVTATLLGAPLTPLALVIFEGTFTAFDIAMFAFVLSPLLAILGYGAIRHQLHLGALVDSAKGYAGFVSEQPVTPTAHQRFSRASEYEYFIVALFSGDDSTTSAFGLRALDDAEVHRFFHGGSDAVTALVESKGTFTIRKFAQGAPGDKLRGQADWLEAERDRGLPLVDIAGSRQGEGFFVYDMPVLSPAADCYEVLHTCPMAEAERLFDRLLEDTIAFHGSGGEGDADEAAIQGYLDGKVIANVDKILEFARGVFPEGLTINEQAYDYAAWERFQDPAWLRAQIRHLGVGRIHGDLTIENVIVSPVVETGYYVIDPNPDNTFNTPLIDWAKLMQSLHLGYEALNRSVALTVEADSVRLQLSRSQVYSSLHGRYEAFLRERLGAEGLREVYFHELVNYLRLTPYKIRQDARKGLAFFACTAVLMRRYLESEGQGA